MEGVSSSGRRAATGAPFSFIWKVKPLTNNEFMKMERPEAITVQEVGILILYMKLE